MQRAHPQLRALDALAASGLTYDHWQTDVHMAERRHAAGTSTVHFEGFLARMQAKQEWHTGDRSDAQLRALAAIQASGLTYAGWREDVREAEDHYTFFPSLFDDFLTRMGKKQALLAGDRSDPQLRALDALTASGLTYDNWQADVCKAEERHAAGVGPERFDSILARMQAKQEWHTGDRSDAQLRALEAVTASGLTYAGWREDVREAEENLTFYPMLFDDFLKRMRRKQACCTGDRSDPQLRALDALAASGLTYDNWQADVRKAEERHTNVIGSARFDTTLARMQAKQEWHTGDRSDAQLRALAAIQASGLTYAGWREDVREAEDHYTFYPSLFDDFLEQMRRKHDAQAPALASALPIPAPQPSRRKRSRDTRDGQDQVPDHTPDTRKKTRQDCDGNAQAAGGEVESTECVVCLTARKEYVFVPCGHVCVCSSCAGTIQQAAPESRKCPLCRKVSERIIKIFF